jgi:hypothetical protein
LMKLVWACLGIPGRQIEICCIRTFLSLRKYIITLNFIGNRYYEFITPNHLLTLKVSFNQILPFFIRTRNEETP